MIILNTNEKEMLEIYLICQLMKIMITLQKLLVPLIIIVLNTKVKEIKTKPYLNDIINDRKSQGEWKIRLTMSINFISSKGSDETHTMHT